MRGQRTLGNDTFCAVCFSERGARCALEQIQYVMHTVIRAYCFPDKTSTEHKVVIHVIVPQRSARSSLCRRPLYVYKNSPIYPWRIATVYITRSVVTFPSSRRASPLVGCYDTTLLVDRATCVWTTCPESSLRVSDILIRIQTHAASTSLKREPWLCREVPYSYLLVHYWSLSLGGGCYTCDTSLGILSQGVIYDCFLSSTAKMTFANKWMSIV